MIPTAPDDEGFEVVPDDLPVARRAPAARLGPTVRVMLVLMALAFAAVLGTAVWLDPYTDAGEARRLSTHTQLGLKPCSVVVLTGKPCPACGMTTSFALTVRADLANAARANWVGLGLCLTVIALVPWAVASAWRGRYYFVKSFEAASTVGVVILLVAMFGRWGALLLRG